MSKSMRVVCLGIAVGLVCMVWLATTSRVQSQPPAKPVTPAAVPEGQTYTGAKRCSSCHFKQYTVWKKSKHAKEAWESVPKKYQADPECLKCHVTGYGAKGGYASGTAPEILQNLLGTTCEACHGPGSKHEEVAKKYTTKKKLEPAEEKEVRGTIYKILPQNVCVRCHTLQGHVEHPKYDKQ
jgi:hypothetical protein